MSQTNGNLKNLIKLYLFLFLVISRKHMADLEEDDEESYDIGNTDVYERFEFLLFITMLNYSLKL